MVLSLITAIFGNNRSFKNTSIQLAFWFILCDVLTMWEKILKRDEDMHEYQMKQNSF